MPTSNSPRQLLRIENAPPCIESIGLAKFLAQENCAIGFARPAVGPRRYNLQQWRSKSFPSIFRVDQQEVRNGVDQAQRELDNRYDFKGSKCEIRFEKDEITLVADDEFRIEQLKDILFSKLLKRGIDARQIGYGKAEAGSGVSIRQKVEFKVGVPQDEAKKLVKQIKDKGLKVHAQIQGEELRVSGKDKDDLQKAIAFVKGLDLPFPVSFVNMR